MLARLRESRDDDGFTLVETFVIMVIIGVLAAIAIPLFLTQTNRSVDASLKSDLHAVATDLESYYTEHESYPATLLPLGTRLSPDNAVAYQLDANGDAFCLNATNAKATAASGWFYISSQGGLQADGTSSCGNF